MINELAKEIHAINVKNGFYEDADNPLKMSSNLALLHSEVSEALEADREGVYCDLVSVDFGEEKSDEIFKTEFEDGVKNTFPDEIADVIIRALDIAAFKGIDIESHIRAKMRYNSLREYKHGKKY